MSWYLSFLGFCWTIFILSLGLQPAAQQDLKPFFSIFISEETLKEVLPLIEINYGGSTVSTENPYSFIQFLIRKGAHFGVYGVLSLIVTAQQICYKIDLTRAFLLGLFFVGIVGSVDELLQHFNPGRSGMVLDVFLDMSGSLISLVWLFFIKGKVQMITEGAS